MNSYSNSIKCEISDDVSNDSGISSNSSSNTVKSNVKNELENVELEIAAENQRENEAYEKANAKKLKEYGAQETFKNLQILLERSAVYSELILARLQKEKEEKLKLDAKLQKSQQAKEEKEKRKLEEKEEKVENDDQPFLRRSTRKRKSSEKQLEAVADHFDEIEQKKLKKHGSGHPRRKVNEKITGYFDENEMKAKKSKYMQEKAPDLKDTHLKTGTFECDLKYFTGGTLRDYQMDGLIWLKAQFEQGINGILADEMGLGKTIQVIALMCHFYAKGMKGPFLIIAPLSTLPNWNSELKRFAPEIPFILYHGHKDERGKLRKQIKKGAVLNGVQVQPIVLTSYEMILYDRKMLANFNWRYMVIDEGHRIKNNNCLLKKELKQLTSCNRLLLTGTPLQNNLTELWSLLNFLLPDIFADLEWFQSFFDFNALHETDGEMKIIAKEREEQIVTKLHNILSPFLLRRIKTDVEINLPPKKEIWVYAPMSPLQLEMYKAAVAKCLVQYFGKEKDFDRPLQIEGKRRSALRPETWDQFEDEENKKPEKLSELYLGSVRSILMTLRKVCLHPYLFDYPLTEDKEHLIDEDLVRKSGRFALLDRLLFGLIERKHKVLLFSQMVLALNLVHDLCFYRGIKFCRLDGSMSLEDRMIEIDTFNNDPTVSVFLISTRAGGLGLNLTAADTVIILDSDWNPQCDLQAQDRCHRIGQTKPVVVYRMLCRGTIDEDIVKRATAKRRLEKMIIHQGNFQFDRHKEKLLKPDELLNLLKSADYNQIMDTCSMNEEVISDEDLARLLDRSSMTSADGNIKVEVKEEDKKNQLFEIASESVDDLVL